MNSYLITECLSKTTLFPRQNSDLLPYAQHLRYHRIQLPAKHLVNLLIDQLDYRTRHLTHYQIQLLLRNVLQLKLTKVIQKFRTTLYLLLNPRQRFPKILVTRLSLYTHIRRTAAAIIFIAARLN